MAEIKTITAMYSKAGIQRDGTVIDRNFFTDGQWCRFQRGRPKKMGGYSQISNRIAGPIRQQLVWSKNLTNALYSFAPGTISLNIMDQNGAGGSVYDLTPVGFTSNADNVWSVDTLWDASGANSIVVAVATPSMTNIDSATTGQVYYAVAGATGSAFAAIAGLTVSGGILAVPPYLVYYGANGQVGWSDANQPQTLIGGDAGSARVTGAKIVTGLQIRGGSGPAALLWSLDSVIKMDWVGGSSIFRFTTLTGQSSILSESSAIEYDGSYYWIGVDRFMTYQGGAVIELPNDMNLNWFFDNLNYAQRQKVWAMKVPRYGEIWWFFPFGNATECTHAVIYNTRLKTWYDTQCARSAGYYSQVFRYPVMGTAVEDPATRSLNVTVTSGSFLDGDRIRGATSGVSGEILTVASATLWYVNLSVPGTDFSAGESITNLTRAGAATYGTKNAIATAYVHEKGWDAIVDDVVQPIESYFETCDFGYPTGSAQDNAPQGLNRWTRIIRIEPDFIVEGNMDVRVTGREWAQGPDTYSDPYPFTGMTQHIDMREQRREIRLNFRSNCVGGHYEAGNNLLHIEPGDVRS